MEKLDINARVIEAINDILTSKKEPNKAALAAQLGIKPAKFSEILNGRMMAGTDLMAELCIKYEINAMWLLTGIGGSYITNVDVQAPLLVTKDDSIQTFFAQFDQFIQKKDTKIIEQAEEIGRLKAQIEELERRRGDSASDAQTSSIASVG
ncbi:MAG: helix-turn-helix domain-containing protein [Bacteroidaceae bacterium]|nr:helix-turn-helix domain-containing protein [Bacteroidaceae bacterium]